ncbi:hypothetical protein FCL47_06230 [Desulfopila sp. IMCC35006]|uniref:hypothetical protein n=1 Tax=Desulfopila sp. IMCC35006 TaxID=2569542 RepID=UPI0010ABE65E|nr:hypothetical protein [Desulfopila sp. IMCC35006]TKB27721.1 hypothetical protein FCL47_06230 [Desulfopila sp. IMCC35006]
MKNVVMIFCILTAIGFGAERVLAATGKCTVVRVDGTQMVIECSEQNKGFAKGNQIKIKTEKKKDDQNK